MEAEDLDALDLNFTRTNMSDGDTMGDMELPIDMKFNDGHLLAIVVYSLLMIISAIGNISVFFIIIRLRLKHGHLSRIITLLLHLTIADLLVTFLMMPLEIIWNATVSWHAGDLMCRLMSFFRIFGLYLSGFLLVCISIDRYFAIVKPLKLSNAKARVKVMLYVAWISSAICSLPQCFIFHVETHPVFTWYEQCVTFHSFPSVEYEVAYNFFGMVFLYGVPLIAIMVCYVRILYKIHQISRLKGNEHLRRSSMGSLSRAKMRTVKMTVIIVAVFFGCWSPYNFMSLWYWFDKSSALKVDQKIQKCLFLFACTNSCFNPIIYGYFHFRPVQNNNNNGNIDVSSHDLHQNHRTTENVQLLDRRHGNHTTKRVRWKVGSDFVTSFRETATTTTFRSSTAVRCAHSSYAYHNPLLTRSGNRSHSPVPV